MEEGALLSTSHQSTHCVCGSGGGGNGGGIQQHLCTCPPNKESCVWQTHRCCIHRNIMSTQQAADTKYC